MIVKLPNGQYLKICSVNCFDIKQYIQYRNVWIDDQKLSEKIIEYVQLRKLGYVVNQLFDNYTFILNREFIDSNINKDYDVILI